MRRALFHQLLVAAGIGERHLFQLRQYLKRNLFFQRDQVFEHLNRPYLLPEPQRIAVAIAHVVSPEEASDAARGRIKCERLQRTIDGLLASFAAHRLDVTVCTASGRHVIERLPAHQQAFAQVRVFDDCDPMHIGFRAHDVLVEKVGDADWFLFIEDDIVIRDGYYLEKMASFSRAVGDLSAYLNPHRYEYNAGRKCYIDLTICTSINWDKSSAFERDGQAFAECSNPHAGTFMLSQQQLERWIQLGRHWRNETVSVGPLETAATYSLMEHFRIFKPAPPNLAYLEVEHFDSKYSWPDEQLADAAKPYAISAIAPLGTPHAGSTPTSVA